MKLPKLRRLIHYIAVLGRPILSVLGVKQKTVASKVADAAEAADKVLPP